MSEKHHSHCWDAMEINDLQCIMRVRSILYRNIKEGVIMAAIGDEFGGRDHSTVVYAIQQVEKNMQSDYKFREMVEDIMKNIQNS